MIECRSENWKLADAAGAARPAGSISEQLAGGVASQAVPVSLTRTLETPQDQVPAGRVTAGKADPRGASWGEAADLFLTAQGQGDGRRRAKAVLSHVGVEVADAIVHRAELAVGEPGKGRFAAVARPDDQHRPAPAEDIQLAPGRWDL